jgi:hypothetical protein
MCYICGSKIHAADVQMMYHCFLDIVIAAAAGGKAAK